MIVEVLGRLFRAWGRARGPRGADLEHVGDEMVRLGERRRQPSVTSR